MSWSAQLHKLSLKTKLAITVIGAAFAVLGASTYFSFTYWQNEAGAVAEQQALFAAASARVSIETALNRGDSAAARRALQKLVTSSAVYGARVYDADNRILISTHESDRATPPRPLWIPSARELPPEGAARAFAEDGRHSVHAFVPIGSRLDSVLEVELSMSVVRTAMERGARLGIGLLIVSLLLIALIIYAMVQREVVQPFAEAEKLAEERRVLLEERAGFAEVGELAAEMAHEFKRPLASIRSAIQLLQQEYTLASSEQNLVVGIEAQLERLSDTMQDVFGLAKPIGIDLSALDLASVLDNALMQVSGAAQAAQVRIQRDYAAPIPMTGDARRLEVAFANLFNNAIDAMTPQGGTLRITAAAHDERVDIDIADTGTGMDEVQLVNAMRPFFSTKATGTGLGLPLVARIVRAHNGDIGIESSKDAGTTVHVTFAALQTPEVAAWQARAS
jgi:signal transduction histidine kinase